MHKRQAKKELRQLRKSGSSPEEVRLPAQKFHLLVRQHSKIVKEARQLTAKVSTKQMRKECHRDIHKFARKILDEENYTSIQPSFGQEQAEEYFSRVYSTTPKSFSHPEWMPECPQPSVPMTTAPFTEEVRGVISSLKSSSAPSPADQIPYAIIKRCHSLLPALLHMYNRCWTTQTIPSAWKVGIVHLLSKKKAW